MKSKNYKKAIDRNELLNYSEGESASLCFGSSKKHYHIARPVCLKKEKQVSQETIELRRKASSAYDAGTRALLDGTGSSPSLSPIVHTT